MATKKPVSAAKKPAKKTAVSSAKKTTTKVTTISSAVSARKPVSARFSFSRSPLLSASIAEFVGAFALAGLILATQGSSIVVLFGVIALTLIVGTISGSHLNPAITVAAWATKRINAVRALCYVVAQVLGALLALVILNAYVSAGAGEQTAQTAMLGGQAVSLFKLEALPANKEWFILGAEALGALLFGFGFAASIRERSRSATAWTIGGSLFVALTVSAALTAAVTTSANQMAGAAPLATVLNPAIAGALQAISFNVWPILVYIVAPVVGAVLGFGLRDLLDQENDV